MFVIQDSTEPEGRNFFRRLPGGRWQWTELEEATTFKTKKIAQKAVERYLEEYYDKETNEILTEEEYNRRSNLVMEPYFQCLRDLEGNATGEDLEEIQSSEEWSKLYEENCDKAFEASDKKYGWRTSTTAKIRKVETTLVSE